MKQITYEIFLSVEYNILHRDSQSYCYSYRRRRCYYLHSPFVIIFNSVCLNQKKKMRKNDNIYPE